MLRFWNSKPQTNPPLKPVKYPAGSFVETEKGYFYIAGEDKRYRLTTKRCLDSWSPHRVIKTTEAAVAKYRVAMKMKFRNGSLIYSISDGKVYLIVEGKRRHVVSPEAYTLIGVDHENLRRSVVQVSIEEINLHPEGVPIT